jgi:hypothetical protein
MQLSFIPHAVLQSPQCEGSLVRSTQSGSQTVRPGGHFLMHVLALHSWSTAQPIPHLPQLSWSVSGSMQNCPQSNMGMVHAALHLPAAQYSPVLHFTLHPPQLSGSFDVSLHVVPQRICDPGHAVGASDIDPASGVVPESSSNVCEVAHERAITHERNARSERI